MALQPVMAGTMPAVFEADSENQIYRAMHIADEFHLKLIVDGGGEAWKLAPALAKKQIPVLLSLNYGDEPGVTRAPGAGGGGRFGGGRPGGGVGGVGGGRRQRGQGGVAGGTGVPNGQGGVGADPIEDPNDPQGTPGGVPGQAPGGAPGGFPGGRGGAGGGAAAPSEDDTPKAVTAEQHKKWEEKIANAAKLQSAGVPFVFSLRAARTPAEFMDNLRKAIKAGLSRDNALKGLTINAAKLYGVDRQMGTVEAGKIADLVVMNGDFAETGTRVRYVFIDKSKFDLANDRPATRAVVPVPTLEEDDDD